MFILMAEFFSFDKNDKEIEVRLLKSQAIKENNNNDWKLQKRYKVGMNIEYLYWEYVDQPISNKEKSHFYTKLFRLQWDKVD